MQRCGGKGLAQSPDGEPLQLQTSATLAPLPTRVLAFLYIYSISLTYFSGILLSLLLSYSSTPPISVFYHWPFSKSIDITGNSFLILSMLLSHLPQYENWVCCSLPRYKSKLTSKHSCLIIAFIILSQSFTVCDSNLIPRVFPYFSSFNRPSKYSFHRS